MKEQRVATILDVACLAGVSTATVSRVVNGSARVSPKTAEIVKSALKACQYQPNADALRLRGLRRVREEKHSHQELGAIETNTSQC
jgi:DNA-binding LacI/PurR family transcriptional regulator